MKSRRIDLNVSLITIYYEHGFPLLGADSKQKHRSTSSFLIVLGGIFDVYRLLIIISEVLLVADTETGVPGIGTLAPKARIRSVNFHLSQYT